jgi:serine/threonine protein phosphatase 1
MLLSVAIGDIHGMAELLTRLLSQIDEWLISADYEKSAQFIFLGDYVDRGPNSKEVLARVRAMQKAGAICLRGNHEQLMILSSESLLGEQNFLYNGGASTCKSLGSAEAFAEAQEWMKTLPLSYEDKLRYYVHAGVKPNVPLEQQDDDTRLWVRDEFLEFSGRFPKYIVHGHTPAIRFDLNKATPDIRNNRCNVDTGAGSGGPLSAAIFDDRQEASVHTITTY